ncbi:MAG: Nif3-like dinuclear metal center hexameric protein [Oscillospiraceae bacterium]|nr:Nif3-like dinuclear metal center hexameric protein [Oscillospiraceae bacterium]
MIIEQIYNYLDTIAPFKNQDKFDNSGLIVGDYNAEAKKVLVCLDVTRKVVAEAIEKEIDLIISHHPLIFLPISKITTNDPLYALVQNNINLIAAHTNLDVAVGGISDLMLAKLGFPKSETVLLPINSDGTGYGRVVVLDTPISAEHLAEKCKAAFDCTAVRYVDSGKALSKIGVSSGSAKESVEIALNAGCDAFICGEVSHDRMVFAANYGLTLIEAGHFHTENIFCANLVDRLSLQFRELKIEISANSTDVCSYVL